MPLTLADLPLEFRPKKTAPTMVFALVILLEAVFAITFEIVQKWPLQTFFTTGLISTLSFLFMVGVCIWGIVDAQTKQDRLMISHEGVLIHLNGVTRQWAWRDMARFHLVLVHARTKLHMVAIEPKGAVGFNAKANIIWPRFGPDTEAFYGLLRAGKARWGDDAPG